MTRLLGTFHPSLDALSAHADRSDVSAARSRVGLHVTRCSACAHTVDEIRALGEAAREEVLPGVSPDVWARIEAELRAGEREVLLRPARETVGSAERTPAGPTRDRRLHVPTGTYAGLGLGLLIAVGGAVMAMLLAPGAKQNLGAASPSRLQLERSSVRPGAAVGMRYRPAPALADRQNVTVWAWYRRRDGAQTWSWRVELARAGTLRRSSAEEFVGSIPFPVDALVAGYVVGDSLGFVIDRMPEHPRTLATVLAADASGKPSFDALVTFLGESRQNASDRAVADAVAQLGALYPGRPETWILTYSLKQRGVIGDIVKLFESRERVYEGWHDKLKARQPLSLETEAMMFSTADDLMDTARADFWVERLVREHGSSPHAPELWIARYRDVPRDSIAAILESFETIWQAARGSRLEALSRALALADRSGDAELKERWHAREREANPFWVLTAYSDEWLADSTSRAAIGRVTRAQLVREMRDTLGTPSLWFTARLATDLKSATRHRLATRLAAIQLLDGDVRGARLVLDSLAAVPDPLRSECHSPAALRWRAEAERRLGEMDAAREDLAYLATSQNWQIAVVGDSAPQLLGSAYSPPGWARAKQAAAPRHRSCFGANKGLTK